MRSEAEGGYSGNNATGTCGGFARLLDLGCEFDIVFSWRAPILSITTAAARSEARMRERLASKKLLGLF